MYSFLLTEMPYDSRTLGDKWYCGLLTEYGHRQRAVVSVSALVCEYDVIQVAAYR